jgi:hypothetical protein
VSSIASCARVHLALERVEVGVAGRGEVGIAGVELVRRSVERALARQEKNGRDHPYDPAEGAEAAVVAYEQLRRDALADSPGGGGIGWVLLLREGVAGWIDRGAAGGAAAIPAAAGDHVVAGLPIPPLHVGIVHVLASIALSRREAMSP